MKQEDSAPSVGDGTANVLHHWNPSGYADLK